MTTNTPDKVAEILRERQTHQLVEDFILTGKLNNHNIPTVRGWIMDELNRRNPKGFNAWLSLDCPRDEDLRDYIYRR